MRILALDIGGTKFSAALFEDGRMIRRETRPTNREAGKDALLAQLPLLLDGWSFARCGIGFGGPVYFDRQRVALSTHAGGWSDFDFPGWIRDRYRVPAIMDNDANAGALGEGLHGAGKGADPLFYMTLSTGIGGGILAGGRLYRGADSYAGEIGHTVIRPGGPDCLCGAKGCYERMCCGLWLERDHGRPAHELLRDPAFTDNYVKDLAAGLKTVLMLLNPARIVIGGGIAKAGDRLFTPLRRELSRQMTAWSKARIDVQPAALADDSVLYGAMEIARNLE